MAGIQASGVGSGLDINSLVTQLVSAENASRSAPILRREAAATTKISALGTLKGALSAFKGALTPLRNLDVFSARKATSADTDRFTASASSAAAAGSYDVEVVNLASAHRLASNPYLDGADSVVGYGSLAISVGDESFNVDIAQDGNTLDDIRDAINDAPDNKGVQATLLTGTEGTRLILTSRKTGAEHAIKIVASGGDGGLAALNYDPSGTMNMVQKDEAKDASVMISGFPVSSSTNVIDGAIEGVTINLMKAEVGVKTKLTIDFDTASVTTRIQTFVTEYNNMQAQLAKLGSYDAASKTAGPLLGDSLLRGIEQDMRRGLTNPVTGATGDYNVLASIGITTTASGALELDQAKLTKALQSDPDSVAHLFGSGDGVAARLFAQVDARLASGSDLDSRNTSLKRDLDQVNDDKEALALRMEQIEARYRKQFTALDSLLSQLQTTSSYLAQQLASVPKAGS
ncbi:MAG TPA: flagellar filament capping protein FliD [Steroidobacteraceae bacterium]|nr:flagellar filament capping protein FliD [Steroidobacteraceae bacterium]